jgi:hypothetical protein
MGDFQFSLFSSARMAAAVSLGAEAKLVGPLEGKTYGTGSAKGLP